MGKVYVFSHINVFVCYDCWGLLLSIITIDTIAPKETVIKKVK